VVDVDSNNEDTIDRLLKIRDNIPMHRDENSVIYALLSQINPQRFGNRTLSQSIASYFIVRNEELHLYLQQFRHIDFKNRHTFYLEDGLYIGRKGLVAIVIKFNKVIIGFQTGKRTVNKNFARRPPVYFPDTKHRFYITEETYKYQFKQHNNFVNDPNSAYIHVSHIIIRL
jgi:hypothetical protein